MRGLQAVSGDCPRPGLALRRVPDPGRGVTEEQGFTVSSTTFQMPTPGGRNWALYAVGLALPLILYFLFHDGIANLLRRWGNQQELSHSYFIPAITAWMLWERRDAIRQSMGSPSLWGAAVLAFAFLLTLGSEATHIYLLQHGGLFLSAFAVSLLVGGVSLFRVTFFPLAYLVFMIPPPFWIITVTSWNFQIWSSQLGVTMIRWFDIPVLLTGNVIDLGVMKLQVVEACSGLRYLFPFVSLAAIAAYFYRGPLWQRFLIVLAAIPITIVMNSFRIAVTGVLSAGGDASHTEGFLHFFEGWVVFVLCIGLLLGLMVLMARLTGQGNVLATLGLPDVEPVKPTGQWTEGRFLKVAGGAAAALFAGSVVIHTVEATPRFPERDSFADLLLEFPEWKVSETRLDVETEQTLGADDYIVVNMVSPEEERLNLYIAYLNAQRDGNSWHSPRQCLPGGGWQFESQGIVPADDPANALGHPYNRIVMKQGDVQYLVYYWYQQRGRFVADEIMMKLWLIWDVTTRQRSDGAMVRLMTQIEPDETVAEAEARLDSFRNEELKPKLGKYIPD